MKHISPGAKLVKLADFASHLKPGPYLVKHPNYIATIRGFLETCPESKAKEIVLGLTNEIESQL